MEFVPTIISVSNLLINLIALFFVNCGKQKSTKVRWQLIQMEFPRLQVGALAMERIGQTDLINTLEKSGKGLDSEEGKQHRARKGSFESIFDEQSHA